MWRQERPGTEAEPAAATHESRSPPEASTGPRWLTARWLMWLVVTIVFTAVIIQYTARRGRLRIWPTCDDIAHLLDGQVRLAALDKGGIPA